jgi:hypothetical protein
MILRLKPRESRPPPDLQTADQHKTDITQIKIRTNQCSTNLPKRFISENNPAKRREQKFNAGWSSPVARQAHNLKVTGSNPVPAPSSSEDKNAAWFLQAAFFYVRDSDGR